MTTELQCCAAANVSQPLEAGPAREIYDALNVHEPGDEALAAGANYLRERLEEAGRLACDLPPALDGLAAWMERRHDEVGGQYLAYLQARKAGAPRRYFSCRAHALYFLQGVAPTKMVDGAWLYGLLPRWRDERFRGLIRTYLEELGEGRAHANHVAMYRKLLAVSGCEHGSPAGDGHYVQGAIQLCLAYGCRDFLPEVVGFNLGYEQLPLHLLITTYELAELGLDSYYFQVHLTVDNAGTGHARKAVEAVRAACPAMGGSQDYYQRVRRGYLLNELGLGTVSVIQSFDLQAEIERILRDKSRHGRHMHSDYCKVAGRTVNDWLSEPGGMADFLQALQRQGWIKRHADPSESRFWRLLQGERAEMFGVFSRYELQVIHDWIAGERAGEPAARAAQAVPLRLRARLAGGSSTVVGAEPGADEQDEDVRLLKRNAMEAATVQDAMALLAGMMAPAVHYTPAGMMATRMFARLMDAS